MKNSIWISLFLIASSAHATGANAQGAAATANSEGFESTQVDSFATNRDRANRIVVKVMINDQGPFNFLLDTGANQSALSAAFAKKMNLPPAAKATTTLRGITGEAIVPLVQVAKLQAGSLLLTNRSMPVIDAALLGLDGVLGVDGFRNKRLSAHIVGKQVNIQKSSGKRASAEFATFQLEFRHGLLVMIPASIPGTKIRAVIDTGASGSLGNEQLRQVIAMRVQGDRSPTVTRVQGVTGAMQTGESRLTSLVRLECEREGLYDAIQIQDLPIAYGDFYVFKLWNLEREPALVVGMDILNLLEEFIIDYGSKELHLKGRRADEVILRTRIN